MKIGKGKFENAIGQTDSTKKIETIAYHIVKQENFEEIGLRIFHDCVNKIRFVTFKEYIVSILYPGYIIVEAIIEGQAQKQRLPEEIMKQLVEAFAEAKRKGFLIPVKR